MFTRIDQSYDDYCLWIRKVVDSPIVECYLLMTCCMDGSE